MMYLINAIFRSFKEIFAKNNRKALVLSIILCIISYCILFSLFGWIIHNFTFFQTKWLENTVDILGGIMVFVCSLFMLPAVISSFSELFSESIIKQTQQDYFPTAPTPTPASTFDSILYSLSFSGKSAFYTIGMMFGYVVILPFFLIPGLNIFLILFSSFILYGVNAYFLGKGYFDTVAMRHISSDDSTTLWKENKVILLLAGFIISFLYTIPIINLVTPIFAFSLMTQLFYKLHTKNI